MVSASHTVTQLLLAWNDGDQTALERLAPLVERELHRLARRYLLNERHGHSLQATELVNEAYVRLIDWRARTGMFCVTLWPNMDPKVPSWYDQP